MSHDEALGLADDGEALARALSEDGTMANYDDEHALSQVDLESDARLIADIVNQLDLTVTSWDGELNIERAIVTYQSLEQSSRDLAEIRKRLADRIGRSLGPGEHVIEGIGAVKRHRTTTYTGWRKDDLLVAVLDSRLVDKETGEVKDETPLDRVLHVFGLGTPRRTAMAARQLQVDEFCTVNEASDDGLLWNLEIK